MSKVSADLGNTYCLMAHYSGCYGSGVHVHAPLDLAVRYCGGEREIPSSHRAGPDDTLSRNMSLQVARFQQLLQRYPSGYLKCKGSVSLLTGMTLMKFM